VNLRVFVDDAFDVASEIGPCHADDLRTLRGKG